ncbi:MAG: hypothetical protein KDA21_03775, partial [Phycisphaerales bacterium]|nr:hypothetical protein [Phycisphaerales bacterium]
LLGPLTNPAGARRQLLGVFDGERVGMMAEALCRLGAERAMVVHGHDGMDEITTVAPTTIAHVRSGTVEMEEFDAASLGVARATHADLAVDTLDGAAQVIEGVLRGESGAARDIVVVNAAAALLVGDVARSWEEGAAIARAAIDEGRALQVLDGLRRAGRNE